MSTKQRDYMFDTFRGILMLSIPMSHFTKQAGNLYSSLYLGGGFPQSTFGGFIYITINVFVMQAFMFLSGFFSKKPDRARESAFKTFMWPYLVFTTVYWLVRMFFFGSSNLRYLYPPFALWFLFALFFYRFLLKDITKFKWLFPLSICLYFIAGQVKSWGDFLSLGRMMSYFVFFLIGFYCSKERLAWLQGLKKHKPVLVLWGAMLVAISIGLTQLKSVPVGWYLLRESYHSFPTMTWYMDILMRILLLLLSFAWIVFAVNVIPSKKGFLAYVGANTMPVYVFHLALRYVIEFYGLYMGLIASLVTAWFAVLSLIFKKVKSRAAYGICIGLSIAGCFALFGSGVLRPIYHMCPENQILFNVVVYGSALICGIAFVSPFWIKLYDLLVDGPLTLVPILSTWLDAPKLKAKAAAALGVQTAAAEVPAAAQSAVQSAEVPAAAQTTAQAAEPAAVQAVSEPGNADPAAENASDDPKNA